MNKGELLYTGKAKSVYATDDADRVVILYRNDTSAFDGKKVEQLAERIIAGIKEPYMIDQTEIRIGVSIGCAFGPIDGATVDDLILKADLALYQAKDAGRGCQALASDSSRGADRPRPTRCPISCSAMK